MYCINLLSYHIYIFLILNLKKNEDIAKELFEKDKKRWLEGYDSLEAYNDDYTGFEGHLHGYFLILNPDTGDAFDDKLNKLEMEYGMVTIALNRMSLIPKEKMHI